jgi:hypothetical protein
MEEEHHVRVFASVEQSAKTVSFRVFFLITHSSPAATNVVACRLAETKAIGNFQIKIGGRNEDIATASSI